MAHSLRNAFLVQRGAPQLRTGRCRRRDSLVSFFFPVRLSFFGVCDAFNACSGCGTYITTPLTTWLRLTDTLKRRQSCAPPPLSSSRKLTLTLKASVPCVKAWNTEPFNYWSLHARAQSTLLNLGNAYAASGCSNCGRTFDSSTSASVFLPRKSIKILTRALAGITCVTTASNPAHTPSTIFT
jgi:hypothetical protein